MAKAFTCSLVTPDAAVFEKQVMYVDLPAHDGQVGIAPGRAPLLTKLGLGPLRLELEDGGQTTYLIDGGFAQMQDGVLSLISEGAELASELSAEQAKAAMEAAEQLPNLSEEEYEQRQHDLDKARAIDRLTH